MREFLGRLVVVLIFWFAFLDRFFEEKGQWIWSVGVIGAFLLVEAAGKLLLWVYLKLDDKESGKADSPAGHPR